MNSSRRASFSHPTHLPSIGSGSPFMGTLPPIHTIQASSTNPHLPPLHNPTMTTTTTTTTTTTIIGPNVSGGTTKIACVPCRTRHIACDHTRPCRRCFLSGRPELCRDEPKKKRGSSADDQNSSANATSLSSSTCSATAQKQPLLKQKHDLHSNYNYQISPLSSHPTTLSSHARSNSTSSSSAGSLGVIIVSTSLRIAHVTDEVCELLKVVPGTLLEQPLVDFIHREDRSLFGELVVRALKHPTIPACPVPVPQDVLFNMPLAQLTQKCHGTEAHRQVFRLKGGRKSFVEMQFCMYLSSAFGGDINRPETYGLMCLVVTLQLSNPENGANAANASRRNRTMSTMQAPTMSSSAAAQQQQQPSSSYFTSSMGNNYRHMPAYPPTSGPASSAAGGPTRNRRTMSSTDTSSIQSSISSSHLLSTRRPGDHFPTSSTAHGLFGPSAPNRASVAYYPHHRK